MTSLIGGDYQMIGGTRSVSSSSHRRCGMLMNNNPPPSHAPHNHKDDDDFRRRCGLVVSSFHIEAQTCAAAVIQISLNIKARPRLPAFAAAAVHGGMYTYKQQRNKISKRKECDDDALACVVPLW